MDPLPSYVCMRVCVCFFSLFLSFSFRIFFYRHTLSIKSAVCAYPPRSFVNGPVRPNRPSLAAADVYIRTHTHTCLMYSHARPPPSLFLSFSQRRVLLYTLWITSLSLRIDQLVRTISINTFPRVPSQMVPAIPPSYTLILL